MRSWILVALALVAAASAPTLVPHAAFAAEAAHDPKSAVAKDGWPDTPAGRTARDWVAAFNAGEAAMRAFYLAHVPAEQLQKKPIAERLEIYRTNRERFGRLTLGSIVSSVPSELEASLIDEDMGAMPYTFTVEKDAPFRLVSITRKELHPHFGFHH